jgi:hypothetical protein
VKIGALDNQPTGEFDIINGTVTVTGNVTNAGSGTDMGIGVGNAGKTGGELMVIGTFTNIGDVTIGNGTAAPTVKIGALDNQSDGVFGIFSGDVTVTGTLTNAASVTIGNGTSTPTVMIGALDNQSTGGVEIVRGTVTVRGDVTNAGSGTNMGIGVGSTWMAGIVKRFNLFGSRSNALNHGMFGSRTWRSGH